MKFISKKGAPDIPLEVLEAQESGHLIFFCGAGISRPAGLPDFKELVKLVYKELSDSPSDLEKQSIKKGQYDRALSLLEDRFFDIKRSDKFLVRKAIIQCLTLDSDADVSSHKSILGLAKTKKEQFRLVTTNVDHGFLHADPGIKPFIDAAPKLPVPKPHKWNSIVHLHGILDERDPNGEHLVFTSGDFGAAYLTERWASKFVSELFTHYTVLFIGYSIEDPVIRYMTDAIAAEQRLDDHHFKKPYILARTKLQKFSKDKAA